MNRLAPILVLALPALLVLGCGQTNTTMDREAAERSTQTEATTAGASEANTILANAQAVPNLSAFARAVQTAGLADELSGPGPYTVFAPTDEAFDLADAPMDDPAELEALLRAHVTEGDVAFERLTEGQTVEMLSGDQFSIARQADDPNELRISEAAIVASFESSNGVLHVINLVLDADGGGF